MADQPGIVTGFILRKCIEVGLEMSAAKSVVQFPLYAVPLLKQECSLPCWLNYIMPSWFLTFMYVYNIYVCVCVCVCVV